MNLGKIILVGIALFSINSTGYARDTVHDFEISNVMESSDAQNKLRGVKFYFGSQKHGTVVKRFQTVATNKKTNAFGKSDQAACEWVFLTALVQLKNKVQQLGGNAVINIKSNYRNNLTSSNTTFQCGAGNVLAGVALQGEVVRLK